ncbi:MAG: hypothetical protein ACRD2G_17720 [Terriglobia bacterium]
MRRQPQAGWERRYRRGHSGHVSIQLRRAVLQIHAWGPPWPYILIQKK